MFSVHSAPLARQSVGRKTFSTGRRTPKVQCSITPLNNQQDEACRPLPLAGKLLAVLSAASLALSPLPAAAVSGGGGISTSLSGQDLSEKDLRKLKLTKANLRQANFSNSDLSGVSLFGALAVEANFSGANLSNADLESGDFEDADLTNAILEGAYANNAQWKHAKITGSDWTDVILRKDIQAYLCKSASGTNPVTGVDTRESLQCP